MTLRLPPPSIRDHHLAQARAACIAWRAAYGRGDNMVRCYELADAARIAAGGDPDDCRAVLLIIAAAAIEHRDWLYAPASRRLAWEEEHLRAAGCWPPPYDRRKWPPIPTMPWLETLTDAETQKAAPEGAPPGRLRDDSEI